MAVAAYRPSALKATHKTGLLCGILRVSRPDFASKMRAVASWPPAVMM